MKKLKIKSKLKSSKVPRTKKLSNNLWLPKILTKLKTPLGIFIATMLVFNSVSIAVVYSLKKPTPFDNENDTITNQINVPIDTFNIDSEEDTSNEPNADSNSPVVNTNNNITPSNTPKSPSTIKNQTAPSYTCRNNNTSEILYAPSEEINKEITITNSIQNFTIQVISPEPNAGISTIFISPWPGIDQKIQNGSIPGSPLVFDIPLGIRYYSESYDLNINVRSICGTSVLYKFKILNINPIQYYFDILELTNDGTMLNYSSKFAAPELQISYSIFNCQTYSGFKCTESKTQAVTGTSGSVSIISLFPELYTSGILDNYYVELHVAPIKNNYKTNNLPKIVL